MKKFLGLIGLWASMASATTYTDHYNLAKPNDGSESWGSELRDNFDLLDSIINAASVTGTAHINDTVGAHAASAISAIPGTNFCSSSDDVAEWLTCLDSSIGSIISGGAVSVGGTDTITGQKTFTAPIIASGGVVGSLTGAVTGNVTGDLTGNTIGTHNGNVVGDVTGNLTGNSAGTHTGAVVGDVTGSISGATGVFGTSLTITPFSTAGVVLNSSAGLLSSQALTTGQTLRGSGGGIVAGTAFTDTSSIGSINWNSRWLGDASNVHSIEWGNRYLIDGSGGVALSWDATGVNAHLTGDVTGNISGATGAFTTSVTTPTLINTGTLTLPTTTTTLVGRSTTDTLSNKTLALSSGNSITSTANFAAQFGSGGGLEASGTTAAELGYLSGTTSAVQTQLNAKASSASLTAHTGASTGVHGVGGTVVGTTDTQTLSGKTLAVGSNTISGTASKVATFNGSGVLAPATTSTTELGYVTGVTSAIQTQLDSKITSGAAAIVNADVATGAAIARTKIANGTASHVLVNDGSGVMSSTSTLALTQGGTGQSSASAAFDALSPNTTKGDLTVRDTSANIRKAVGTNGQVLSADSASTGGIKWIDPTTGTNANYIINGAIDLWQRGTSLALATGVAKYLADRFFMAFTRTGTSGALSYLRSTDTPSGEPFNYSIQADPTAAFSGLATTDNASIGYIVEGQDFKRLAGKAQVLSFWVKSTKTGTACVAFRNSASNRGLVKEYTISSADTWEQKSISFTHDTTGTWVYDNGIGLRINWNLVAGTGGDDATADTWAAEGDIATASCGTNNLLDSATNNVFITGVKLEAGSSVTPFIRAGITIAGDQLMAQRYYEAQSTLIYYTASGAAGATVVFKQDYSTEKRTAPTVTLTQGTLTNVTGSASTAASTTFKFEINATPTAANGRVFIGTNNDASWTADAEL